MSWIGDSLSSLTGQLSNFTKEVLHEGREETSDHVAELTLSSRKIQDLETECNKLRTEVSRLRSRNVDVEERCRAADLQASALLQQSRDLKALQKLAITQPNQNCENEIVDFKAKIEDLEGQLRECSERHLQQISSLQDHQEEKLRQLHERYRAAASATGINNLKLKEDDLGLESLDSEEDGLPRLKQRLFSLEEELQQSKQREALQAEQLREAQRNALRSTRQLEKLQQGKVANEKLNDNRSNDQEMLELRSRVSFLEQLLEETNNDRDKTSELSQGNCEELQARIGELEQQVLEQEQQLSELSSEKDNLDQSLVELDGQHEEAIEQLLTVKNELQNENRSVKKELISLKEQNTGLQIEVETLKEQLLYPSQSIPNHTPTELNETTDDVENKDGSLNSILQSMNDISADNVVLEEKLEKMEKEQQRLETLLFESEEKRSSIEVMASQSTEDVKRLKEQLIEKGNLNRTVNTEREHFEAALMKCQEELRLYMREKNPENKLEEALQRFRLEQERMEEIIFNQNSLAAENDQRLDELQTKLDQITVDSKTELELLKVTLEKSEEGRASLVLAVAESQQELVNLKEQLKGKAELEQTLLNAKTEKEKFEVELIRANEAKGQLELQILKNETELQQLSSKVAELESIVLEKNAPRENNYFSGNSENSDLVSNLQQLTSENENLQNESDDLRVRLMEISGEKERLRVTVDDLTERSNDTCEKLEQQKQVIEALEHRLEETEKSNVQNVDNLQQKIEEISRELAEFNVRESQILSKNKELEENSSNCDEMRNRISELELLVEGAQRKLTEVIPQKSVVTQTVTICESVGIGTDESDDQPVNSDAIHQLEAENKSLKIRVNDLTHSKADDTNEKDFCDLKNLLRKKDTELVSLASQLESVLKQSEASSSYTRRKESEITDLKSKIAALTPEEDPPSKLAEHLRAVETEKEQLVVILNEKTRECSSLKAEVHRLVSFVSAEKQALSKLQQDNKELVQKKNPDSEMSKEVIQNLSRIIKDKDFEIDALKQKVGTLLDIAQQQNPEQQSQALGDLLAEREMLSKQLKNYQADREQISVLLNQKHQESLRYHEEMQKMAVRLTTECQRYESLKEEHRSVSQLFEEKQKSLLNTQNEVVSLKQRVSELERQHTDLRDKYKGLVEVNTVTVQVNRDELSERMSLLESLEQQKADQDHLLSEKDQMIYDLGQSLRRRESDSLRKDQALSSLQHRMDTAQFQLNEALARLKEAESESARLRQSWEQVREEKGMLGESNRNLSMALQKAHSQQDSKRDTAGLSPLAINADSTTLWKTNGAPVLSVATPQLLVDGDATSQAQLESLGLERDQLLLALAQLQQENTDATQEKSQLQKQNEKLHRELDRLRTHLLELQDNYTQEVMVAEEREKELRQRLSQAEAKATSSSSAIINASQEASLRVESLQSQLSRIVRQRDAALEQISQLEDRVQEQSAAHTNLQLAVEQLQTGHQRELQDVKLKQITDFESARQQIQVLQNALEQREGQLADTSEALAAASRLSEQLDRKEEVVNQLKEEVTQGRQQIQKLLSELKEMESHSEGKVDKMIMKSLVLNYFQASATQKPEMVRLLARILDFNQSEMEKAGLKIMRESSALRPGGGWLTHFIHRPATPPLTPIHIPSSAVRKTQPSFSALFVQFLETESRPQTHLHLPIEEMSEGIVNRRGTVADIFPRTQLTPIKTITTTTTSTTTVVAEHPLMRPISTALPTFTPVVSNEEDCKNTSVFLKEVLQ